MSDSSLTRRQIGLDCTYLPEKNELFGLWQDAESGGRHIHRYDRQGKLAQPDLALLDVDATHILGVKNRLFVLHAGGILVISRKNGAELLRVEFPDRAPAKCFSIFDGKFVVAFAGQSRFELYEMNGRHERNVSLKACFQPGALAVRGSEIFFTSPVKQNSQGSSLLAKLNLIDGHLSIVNPDIGFQAAKIVETIAGHWFALDAGRKTVSLVKEKAHGRETKPIFQIHSSVFDLDRAEYKIYSASSSIRQMQAISGRYKESLPVPAGPIDFRAAARSYADAMLKFGRDHYGKKTPAFASTIDRSTNGIPTGVKHLQLALNSLDPTMRENRYQSATAQHARRSSESQRGKYSSTIDSESVLPDSDWSFADKKWLAKLASSGWGVRRHDRALFGANPMHDIGLFQLLRSLGHESGGQKYSIAADNALQWFAKNARSKSTGLLAWGEHLSWNFFTEQRVQQHSPEGTHELFDRWRNWEFLEQYSEQLLYDFGLALWKNQIHNRKDCSFDRHASFDSPGTRPGKEFPRHAGYYLLIWAKCFEWGKDRIFLKAITRMARSLEETRNSKSQALPAMRSLPELTRPLHELSYLCDLHEAAQVLPPEVSKEMMGYAKLSDDVFLRCPHDVGCGGSGIVKAAYSSTLKPGDPRGKLNRTTHTELWGAGYGRVSDAAAALAINRRAKQLKSGRAHDKYMEMFWLIVSRYIRNDPDNSYFIYPQNLQEVVDLMLSAYEQTRDRSYLSRAEHFGKIAHALFMSKHSALPKVTSLHYHDHYETITGGSALMNSFYSLGEALAGV